MKDNYLESTRKRSWDNKVSEAEVLMKNDALKAAWDEVQRIKDIISEEHVKAAAEITARHQAELEDALMNYSLLLSLTR